MICATRTGLGFKPHGACFQIWKMSYWNHIHRNKAGLNTYMDSRKENKWHFLKIIPWGEIQKAIAITSFITNKVNGKICLSVTSIYSGVSSLSSSGNHFTARMVTAKSIHVEFPKSRCKHSTWSTIYYCVQCNYGKKALWATCSGFLGQGDREPQLQCTIQVSVDIRTRFQKILSARFITWDDRGREHDLRLKLVFIRFTREPGTFE